MRALFKLHSVYTPKNAGNVCAREWVSVWMSPRHIGPCMGVSISRDLVMDVPWARAVTHVPRPKCKIHMNIVRNGSRDCKVVDQVICYTLGMQPHSRRESSGHVLAWRTQTLHFQMWLKLFSWNVRKNMRAQVDDSVSEWASEWLFARYGHNGHLCTALSFYARAVTRVRRRAYRDACAKCTWRNARVKHTC